MFYFLCNVFGLAVLFVRPFWPFDHFQKPDDDNFIMCSESYSRANTNERMENRIILETKTNYH